MKKLSDDLWGFTSNMHERALALESRAESLETALTELLADSIERHCERCAEHCMAFFPTEAEAKAQEALNPQA